MEYKYKPYLEKEYNESKDSNYAPGDHVDSAFSRVDKVPGKRALLLEDASTACNDLAMCCELMTEEHGQLSESYAEAYHQYGSALLA